MVYNHSVDNNGVQIHIGYHNLGAAQRREREEQLSNPGLEILVSIGLMIFEWERSRGRGLDPLHRRALKRETVERKLVDGSEDHRFIMR